MSVVLMVLLALVLDYFFGEPEKIWEKVPHPATLMGRAVNGLDEFLNTGSLRRIKGFLAVAALVIGALAIGWIIAWIPDFGLLEVLIAAVLIAHHSLIQHVRGVAEALEIGLPEGRNAVSMIVGRDTGTMAETDVARASIESAAENFSDGVIAPAFWFLIFGLPGILIYKVINTADSMIGYQSDEYVEFGYAAAKLDDLLNWIPARLTAGLICLAHFSRSAWDVVLDDADMHRSPNAGWPEAAMAGVLDVALSGPRSYDGHETQDPYVNDKGKRELNRHDVLDAIAVLNRSWYVLAGFLAVLTALFWIF